MLMGTGGPGRVTDQQLSSVAARAWGESRSGNDDRFARSCDAVAIFDDVALHVVVTAVQRALRPLVLSFVRVNLASKRALEGRFLTLVSNLPVHRERPGSVGFDHL